MANRVGSRGGASRYIELAENGRNVGIGGAPAYEEVFGNLNIGFSLNDQIQYFELSARQR